MIINFFRFRNKHILVKQHDLSDCGAACLTSVSAFYQLILPIARVRQYTETDKNGSSLLGLVAAAEFLGFSTKAFKGTIDSLSKIPIPAIAHVVIENVLEHYVVIYEVKPDLIRVMDPAIGKMISYTIQDFKRVWTGAILLLYPTENFKPVNEKISISSRFLDLIRPHRKALFYSFIGVILYTLIGVSIPLYLKEIIDNIVPASNKELLTLLSLGFIILVAIQTTSSIAKNRLALTIGRKIDTRLITDYYAHLLSLQQKFFDQMRVGEIISRINDAVKIRQFLNEILLDVMINALIVVFSISLIFSIHWKLGLLTLLILPVFTIIYWFTNRFNQKVEREIMEHSAEFESQLVESIHSIKTIKFFGVEAHVKHKVEKSLIQVLDAICKSGMNDNFSTSSSHFTSAVFMILTLWMGAGLVMNDIVSLGELLSFYALMAYFTSPINSLVLVNKSYQNAIIAADRLFEIIDIEGVKHTQNRSSEVKTTGDIVFTDVWFGYNRRKWVFSGLNLSVRQGQITAILGESGSGKTTIAMLIKAIYSVERGRISIGECSLQEIDKADLSKTIAIIPQEIHIFSGTILENIAIGDASPNMQKINMLAHEIGLIDFINTLPNKFETLIGENGANLSGGQKQRIAILRALYLDPKVIIFDESTSALDIESEVMILQTIIKLKNSGKTIITISHSITMSRIADRILILKEGEIVGEGTHEELVASNRFYKDIYSLQSGFYSEHIKTIS